MTSELLAAGPGGPANAYSFPWDAPLVPPFPFGFRDVTMLSAFYRTDPEAIERLLPPPLERVADVVAIHISHMGDVDHLGVVDECNIMVGARLETSEGVLEGGFSTGMYISSPAGVAHGREVHGQPKKLARVSLETSDDLLVGRVERNGIDIVTTTLPYKQRRAEPADMRRHFDFSLNLNYKVIPNIDGTPAVRELTARRLEDIVVRECWTGPCTVELRPNANAPVWRLPVIEPIEGFLWSSDFRLVGGRRVHDYLAVPS